MRAAVVRGFGPAETLRVIDWREPSPGPGEVLLAVHAVTTASFDATLRARGGALGVELPRILGQDPAGRIVALGDGVSDWVVGDRVVAGGVMPCGECDGCRAGAPWCARHSGLGLHRDGGHAELVAVAASTLVRIPPQVTFEQAACVALTYPVAWSQLVEGGRLQAGDTVLVMAAGGGLGLAAIHVAAARGASVIAAAGAAWKLDRLGGLPGVIGTVDYSHAGWEQQVLRLTDGRGVDVIAENIADPALFAAALSTLTHGGRLVTSGAHGGGIVELDVRSLYLRRQSIVGSNAFTPQATAAVWEAIGDRRLAPPPAGDRLPLSEIAEAHRRVEQRESFGRVLLVVREEAA